MNSTRSVARWTLALVSTVLLGCEPAGPPPVAQVPQTAQNADLGAMSERMAATLTIEADLLNDALRDYGSLDQTRIEALRGALADRREIAAEFESMLRANPTWVSTTCDWYRATIEDPLIRVTRLRIRLADMPDPESERTLYTRLLLDVAGSKEAVGDDLRWRRDHPGSPENLAILCERFDG